MYVVRYFNFPRGFRTNKYVRCASQSERRLVRNARRISAHHSAHRNAHGVSLQLKIVTRGRIVANSDYAVSYFILIITKFINYC